MSDIKVLALGTRLQVTDDISGVITHVKIGPAGAVEYLVAWWHNGERKCEWLPGFEVDQGAGARISVGFQP